MIIIFFMCFALVGLFQRLHCSVALHGFCGRFVSAQERSIPLADYGSNIRAAAPASCPLLCMRHDAAQRCEGRSLFRNSHGMFACRACIGRCRSASKKT